MKTLENKTVKLPDGEVTYGEWIEAACRNTPTDQRGEPRGLSFDDLEIRQKIKKVVADSNGTIELEDADAAYLQRIVLDMRWRMTDDESVNDEIVEFGKAIAAL